MTKRTRFLVISGLIAALYAALTYLSAALGLAYGQVQIRLSEALCMLCAFTPAAVPGLAVGCLIGNIGSAFGIADMIIGSAATLASALIGRAARNIKIFGVPIMIPISFIIVNMLAVGGEIAFFASGEATLAVFLINAATVGIGQIVACGVIGIPLYFMIDRSRLPQILK